MIAIACWFRHCFPISTLPMLDQAGKASGKEFQKNAFENGHCFTIVCLQCLSTLILAFSAFSSRKSKFPVFLMDMGSLPSIISGYIDSMCSNSTLFHELVPNIAQVGTTWLHLLSHDANERCNCFLCILSYQGPTHGTDDRGSSWRQREVQRRSVNPLGI